MAVLGFIGMGNMGYAMLKGCKKAFEQGDIIFHSNSMEKMKKISEDEDIQYGESNINVASNAKYIIMAVKPQMFDTIINEINEVITEEKIIISLAPGFTIKQLKDKFKAGRIVRTMPNTPAMVGEGMTGVCYDDNFSKDEMQVIEKIFSSFGKMRVVNEKLMNAVVCASGSSPAYVFMFMEALADSAVKCGLPRKDAYEFVAQTVLGSAKLMLETGMHPGALKDMVCSPGGTTIAGVAELEKNGLRKAIFEATDACFDKCNNIV
ncbi:MAG: pyrroline-5-carboxylate reductase [Eubacterium sp.]